MVERLAWGGKGLARAEDGRLILLDSPLALFPGEQVEAELRWKPRHAEGAVLAWIAPSPAREAPACPVAERCGGCELQGAGAAAGGLKRGMVEDLLHRQLPGVRWDWHPAPPEVRRHRIQVHWDGTDLGFHRRRSHQVVAVRACPAAAQPLSDALPRLREAIEAHVLPHRPQRWELATGTPAGEVRAIAEDGRAWRLEPDGWHPDREGVIHLLGPLRLGHQAGAFFQVCAPWAMALFAQVLRGWELRGGTLFDLFGGVGLFSALLGEAFTHRVLVESEAAAVAWARRNLAAAGLHSECLAEDVGAWLPEGLGAPADTILLDPPRTGLGPDLCAKLQGATAGTLVLVGCDGAAFCRDVKALAPRWRLRELAALDLFPLTSHAEFVGRFEGPARLEA